MAGGRILNNCASGAGAEGRSVHSVQASPVGSLTVCRFSVCSLLSFRVLDLTDTSNCSHAGHFI